MKTQKATTTRRRSTTRTLRVKSRVKAGPTQVSYPGVYIQELRSSSRG